MSAKTGITAAERDEKAIKTREAILHYYQKGYTPRQILMATQVPRSTYSYHAMLLRAEGLMGETNTLRNPFPKMRLGNVSDIFTNVDVEIRQWAKAEARDYETVAEFLREVLLEHYYESVKK
jgi:DNA-binding transcriptional ArsR family regulator